ncbi:MAG: carboxypeptidase-like regulatory domain-containing protein [Chitinophagaceae bacterium]|nr:carboxypeptidase-like regulatory domain-containing protein [Chitinophagaceae bacterium]
MKKIAPNNKPDRSTIRSALFEFRHGLKSATLLLLIQCLFWANAAASPFSPDQDNTTVTGRVTDAAGNPLEGVSVVVKGPEKTGTSTDKDGQFSIQVPSGSATLVFTYTGMVMQEVPHGRCSGYWLWYGKKI